MPSSYIIYVIRLKQNLINIIFNIKSVSNYLKCGSSYEVLLTITSDLGNNNGDSGREKERKILHLMTLSAGAIRFIQRQS